MMETTDCEQLHKHTDAIYRHLADAFMPGLRHLVTSGRSYHKALTGMSSVAQLYIDSIVKLGHSCRTTCRGATQTIGEALFQIAGAYRQIQNQIDEMNKALLSDFITPLENKLETHFKDVLSSQKKYLHGHKAVAAPYDKANTMLKKIRRKSKSRGTFHEDEAQYVKKVEDSKRNVVKYRTQGLKMALLEERKYYCYVLDKCCDVVKLQADHHSKAGNFLHQQIPYWSQLCIDPNVLPPESVALTQVDGETGMVDIIGQTTLYRHSNGYLSNGPQPSPARSVMNSGSAYEAPSYGRPALDYHRQQSAPDLAVDANHTPRTMSRTISVPQPTVKSPQVRALYNHDSEGENQLQMIEGDIITLIGEKSDGWHFGVNTRTNKYGWFPLAFAVSTATPLLGTPAQNNMGPHYRSMGDIIDRDTNSISDRNSDHVNEPVGIISRPRSMYDGSASVVGNNAQQSPKKSFVVRVPSSPSSPK